MKRHHTPWLGSRDGAWPSVEVNGALERRLAHNLNVSIDGTDETLASRLEGLAVSAGSACATGRIEPSHVLRAIGVDAARARHPPLRPAPLHDRGGDRSRDRDRPRRRHDAARRTRRAGADVYT